jgi:hypothetical protein
LTGLLGNSKTRETEIFACGWPQNNIKTTYMAMVSETTPYIVPSGICGRFDK